jgi:hypothetical protein
MRQLFATFASAVLLATGAAAHHEIPGRTHDATARVRLTQPVLAGGQRLAPGIYELVITEHATAAPSGEVNRTQRWVDFVQDGRIVAREIAEVFDHEPRPVGTSGGADARAVVQNLKGGEFVRIAVMAGDGRYLVHLPLSQP